MYYAQRISNNIVMYGADGPYVKVQQARDWLSKGWWCDKGGRSGAANGEGAFFLLSGALESIFFSGRVNYVTMRDSRVICGGAGVEA